MKRKAIWSSAEYKHWVATGETPEDVALKQEREEKRSKYRNQRVIVDGIRFDSLWESEFYGKCKLRLHSGELKRLYLKVPLFLPGGIKYILDFLLYYPDGSLKHVDTKGVRTQVYVNKKKQAEELLDITIIECYKDGRIYPAGETI